MVTIKVEMNPEKEAALRARVAQHGGALNAYVLPFLNMLAEGTLTLEPRIMPPSQVGKAA